MEFKVDASGKPLKYKIIVRECHVHAVLYNDEALEKEVKEIPFKEIVIEPEVQWVSKDDNAANPTYFGQISNVPTGMIACADLKKLQVYEEIKLRYSLKNNCNARGFLDLMGFVDFDVLSIIQNEIQQIQTSPLQQGMAICSLQPASKAQISEYVSLLSHQNQSNLDQLLAQLDECEHLLTTAEKSLNEPKINKELIPQLQAVQSNLDGIYEDLT